VALDIHIAVDALYCVGQCAISPEALAMGSAQWLAVATSVLDGCSSSEGSAASSVCTTAHPLHTRIANPFGTSISETIMRPNPRCGAAIERGVAELTAFVASRPPVEAAAS
jgi:hypothetical protein